MDVQNRPNNENIFPENVNDPVQSLSEPVICHNPHCGFQTFEPMSRCPHCQRPMWTTNAFRLIMSFLLPLGLAFLLVGGGLGFATYRTYIGAAEGIKNEETFVIIMSFLALFFSSFGLAVMAAGAWAVIFGKANWTIIKAVLGFMMGMLLIAGFGQLVLYLLLD